MAADRAPLTFCGSINHDLNLVIGQAPIDDGSSVVIGNALSVGGHAFNAASYAAALGVPAVLDGAIGDDIAGQKLVRCAAERGIDVRHVSVMDDAPTGRVTIIKSHEWKHMLFERGANDLPRRATKCTENLVLMDAPGSTLEAVLAGGTLPLIFSPGGIRVSHPAAHELVKRTPITVLNSVEASVLFGTRDISTIMALVPEVTVVITRGAEGSSIAHQGTEIDFPAYDMDVKDATGAGDAFVGGLATALWHGLKTVPAIEFASAVASESVTAETATGHCPNLGEAMALILSKEVPELVREAEDEQRKAGITRVRKFSEDWRQWNRIFSDQTAGNENAI